MARYERSRRDILTTGFGTAILAGIGAGPAAAARRLATAPVTEGPFYPVHQQGDRDFDMTRFGTGSERATGDVILVEGQVLDESGTPIPGSLVDVWQANTWGRYHHEGDPNPAPRDPHFQGWAQILTDQAGRYRLLTIKPGAYPVDGGWTRPPHIHFKTSKRGFREITTQMFFEGEPLNEHDRLYLDIPESDRAGVTARTRPGRTEDGENVLICRFDLVLRKA